MLPRDLAWWRGWPMTRRYALRDDQWERIEGLLPGRKETVDVTAKDNRLFVEAVLYRYRTGIPWCDWPERFGHWSVVHTRFSRWAESGVWEHVFNVLAADADNEYAMLDSPIVRAHQHSAGAQKKRAKIKPSGAAKADWARKSTRQWMLWAIRRVFAWRPDRRAIWRVRTSFCLPLKPQPFLQTRGMMLMIASLFSYAKPEKKSSFPQRKQERATRI